MQRVMSLVDENLVDYKWHIVKWRSKFEERKTARKHWKADSH